SRGADLALEQAQAATVDAFGLQPVAVLGGVRPGGGEHRGRLPEQREVVGVVAGDASPSLLEVVDQKAQVQDVRLVEKDVVLETTLEGQDVVVRDRTRAEDHRAKRLAEKGRAPRRAGRPSRILVLTRRGRGTRAGEPVCARPGAAASDRSPAPAAWRSGRSS